MLTRIRSYLISGLKYYLLTTAITLPLVAISFGVCVYFRLMDKHSAIYGFFYFSLPTPLGFLFGLAVKFCNEKFNTPTNRALEVE